jgi:hypothetical protein
MGPVALNYSYPIIGDSLRRSIVHHTPLRAIDETTFVHDYPSTFRNVPADTEISFWLTDESVVPASPFPISIARDIYVNEARIRVEDSQTGPYFTSEGRLEFVRLEHGRFKISRTGVVY